MGLNYITAKHLLNNFKELEEGNNVFIHGISGNVGLALADFISISEISHNLYGTCSEKKIALVKEAGAKQAFNRLSNREEWQCPQGYDLVVESLGFHNLPVSRKLLKKRGRLVFLGLTRDAEKGRIYRWMGFFVLLFVLAKGTLPRFYVFGCCSKARVSDCLKTWQENIDLYRRGKLDPKLGNDYAFEEVRKAHKEMDAGSTKGKMTLRIDAYVYPHH